MTIYDRFKMGRGNSINKFDRLQQLLGKLKSGDPYTTARLADELAVSERTLMRDLDVLRKQGYPIESEKGRGGGVRLYPRWGIGRINLNYREVIDLLLALSVLEKMDSPLFLNNLSSVRNKLFASFPDTQRQHIQQLRRRILIGQLASDDVLNNYQHTQQSPLTDEALTCFIEQKTLRMAYQRADGEISAREVDIHYLFLNWPVWYFITWDHLRQSPRMFRIDRVLDAKQADGAFLLKSIDFFCAELERFAKQL